ncbi:MAG TPA: protein kinase family protein [Nocardioidaceae bacterium]|nr:protein kinase family protein [Nocardioidaceae bacterium]
MTDKPIGRGTVLAGRFRLEDLVQDTDGARFWRAIDQTLARSVAVNVIEISDPRSDALLVAARTSATITEGHFLRVLDAAQEDGVVYVVHEWGSGMSLDKLLADGPLPPRRAAWLVKEVADAITFAHSHGIAHGRLVPENVMVTDAGSVKLIGFVVDAVLHGRRQPATVDGRTLSDHESDVHNLAGLLYATLVGKWPGTQTSVLPEAPRDHDRILRPRQVRAGVPRSLDAVCDRVLNPGSPHGSLETAHEISAALSDFIGDPAAAPPLGHEPTSVIDEDELARFRSAPSAQPAVGVAGGDVEATKAVPHPAAQAGSQGGARPSADPEATQAAPPMFDDDELDRGRRAAPPPPPPLPEPEARPLFAPGPPRAASQRHDAGADEPSGPVRGFHSTHGTGSLPPVWGPDSPPEADEDWGKRDSSRDWLKLAAAVAVIVLLVLAVIFAFNLGRGSGGSPSDEPSAGGETSGAPSGPVSLAGVSDLDPPPAGNGEENPEQAGLAIDGDPSTAWQTMEYYGNPKFGLLKDGVGLVVDLGRQQEVSSAQVTVQGSPTSLEILAAPDGSGQPTSVDNLRRVASANGVGGKANLDFGRPVRTQYLVVWLTSLPPAEGAYRGRVAEIVVRR